MGKQITVRVSDEGVQMDYGGFVGNACHEQHNKIVQGIQNLGIKAKATMSMPKAQMAADPQLVKA